MRRGCSSGLYLAHSAGHPLSGLAHGFRRDQRRVGNFAGAGVQFLGRFRNLLVGLPGSLANAFRRCRQFTARFLNTPFSMGGGGIEDLHMLLNPRLNPVGDDFHLAGYLMQAITVQAHGFAGTFRLGTNLAGRLMQSIALLRQALMHFGTTVDHIVNGKTQVGNLPSQFSFDVAGLANGAPGQTLKLFHHRLDPGFKLCLDHNCGLAGILAQFFGIIGHGLADIVDPLFKGVT